MLNYSIEQINFLEARGTGHSLLPECASGRGTVDFGYPLSAIF